MYSFTGSSVFLNHRQGNMIRECSANQGMRDQHDQRIAGVAAMMQGLPQAAAAPVMPDPADLDAALQENFDRFVRSGFNTVRQYTIQRERLVSSLTLRSIQLSIRMRP